MSTLRTRRLRVGDWIRISWMAGSPGAQVVGIADYGEPIVEHPLYPGLGPITVDVYDWICGDDDPRFHAHGAGI